MLGGVRSRVIDLGYAAGWSLVKSAPEAVSSRVFRGAADLAAVRNGGGTCQLRKNLRRVVGPQVGEREMDEIVATALRSYARYWLETFRLPKMDVADVVARVDAVIEGPHYIDEALERGRGAVLALPHQGNWDVAGIWLVAHLGGSFVTVAEKLKPESLFDRFVEFRERLGFEVHALGGGAPSPTGVLTERMKQNKVACLLADRDLSHSGVPVDFFGEAVRMPPGPAMLAATTGAALLPVSAWYTADGWGLRVNPPIELRDGRLRDKVHSATQALARVFEKDIAEHPADWHMLQKLWLADL